MGDHFCYQSLVDQALTWIRTIGYIVNAELGEFFVCGPANRTRNKHVFYGYQDTCLTRDFVNNISCVEHLFL